MPQNEPSQDEWNPNPRYFGEIIVELMKDKHPDVKRLSVDTTNTRYSSLDLVNELRRGTEVGRELYRLHLGMTWHPDKGILEDLVRRLTEGTNPDLRGISFGEKVYTANELVAEVRGGTDIGRKLYQQHLEVLKDMGRS